MAPAPGSNQVDAVGKRSAVDQARRVYDMHRQALNARRGAMLLWEKLLLHVDGSGDMQWADILYGTKVEIPRLVSEYRKSENLLRAVIDNAVAHHTTMPLRYFADRGPDRASVDAAIIDTLWINNQIGTAHI